MVDADNTPGGPERRLRRVEPGDPALIRRAEEAEASVRTLEGHVADLRRGLREVEEELRRSEEQLDQREHEVRRVKQREYAEQQLRVEAEEQRERLEREQRGELDRLQQRLAAGERHARELAERLEVVRHERSEAEQAAATGRAVALRAEQQLAERMTQLAWREQEFERQIEDMRLRHTRMEAIVRELRGLVEQLQRTPPAPAAPAPRSAPREPVRPQPSREEMAQALADAVARLRARVPAPPERVREPERKVPPWPTAQPPIEPPAPARPAPHKHSMSLIARARMARKQRRAR
jgi:chromosome segregation ATPase